MSENNRHRHGKDNSSTHLQKLFLGNVEVEVNKEGLEKLGDGVLVGVFFLLDDFDDVCIAVVGVGVVNQRKRERYDRERERDL